MSVYTVYENVCICYAYEVEAENEQDAEQKLQNAGFTETDDIMRTPEYDRTISREAECN